MASSAQRAGRDTGPRADGDAERHVYDVCNRPIGNTQLRHNTLMLADWPR